MDPSFEVAQAFFDHKQFSFYLPMAANDIKYSQALFHLISIENIISQNRQHQR